ncbi:hypothetical protein [Anaeromyxobacter paludicola]|uniref:Uncharacterized protein n=1 Tax=Anaeromyxobacter paludicola TaxID=2918171 RepID=A0ABM7XDG1_9BACT|nr:hypothetical protein [Anaeromyxobacter paludicola]BDG09920.1 hypothetical protein AMPC_30330 [Anaeromyxobacter paludicola]
MTPEVKLEGLSFRVFRGAELEVSGTARSATWERGSAGLSAEQVVAHFPPSEGRPAASVTAARMTGSLRTHDFAATGGLVASQGAERIESPSGRYSSRTGFLSGDEQVEVFGKGYQLSGKGYALDPTTRALTIGGRAHLVAGEGGSR